MDRLAQLDKIAQLEMRIARMEKQAFLTDYIKKVGAWLARVPYVKRIAKLLKSIGVKDLKSAISFKKKYDQEVKTSTFKKAMKYINSNARSLKDKIKMVLDTLDAGPVMSKKAYYGRVYVLRPLIYGGSGDTSPSEFMGMFLGAVFLFSLILTTAGAVGTFGFIVCILLMVGISAYAMYGILEKMVEWGWIDDPRAKKEIAGDVQEFEESSKMVAESFVTEIQLKEYNPVWVDDEKFESRLDLISYSGRKAPLILALKRNGEEEQVQVNVAGKTIGVYEYSERGFSDLTRDLRKDSVQTTILSLLS
jgi:hypothetical protein